ncbi:unnamed protein product [Hermetia illucens]|uniref:small monomeric GTPase n=1 Tax=Hermetia illucens TaxID=343691 RepID=A0A7R8Z1H7_HERIL|nr:unnamed protein product [Hermetia illucens]
MTHLNRIKVVVLGSSKVGKSAVTVRYLTKRYIGEYSSTSGRYPPSFQTSNTAPKRRLGITKLSDSAQRHCFYQSPLCHHVRTASRTF